MLRTNLIRKKMGAYLQLPSNFQTKPRIGDLLLLLFHRPAFKWDWSICGPAKFICQVRAVPFTTDIYPLPTSTLLTSYTGGRYDPFA